MTIEMHSQCVLIRVDESAGAGFAERQVGLRMSENRVGLNNRNWRVFAVALWPTVVQAVPAAYPLQSLTILYR